MVEADDVQAPQVRRALADFTAAALDTNLVNRPVQVTAHPKQNVVEISVPLAGNGSDSTSRRAVQVLRDDVIPQTLGKVSSEVRGVPPPVPAPFSSRPRADCPTGRGGLDRGLQRETGEQSLPRPTS
ncbi:hypothetical protein AB0I51_23035 [Streptomyces sp. NPDC050549]|uniref:hypothetical protein n=1 Tax=Streptomyces sp. NPDC050549 TaxID=3155406 RepID=UPI003436A0FC